MADPVTLDYGTEFTVENTTLLATDVNCQFIGLSLTEHNGLNMRRITIELHEAAQIRSLRDVLSAFLGRYHPEVKEENNGECQTG